MYRKNTGTQIEQIRKLSDFTDKYKICVYPSNPCHPCTNSCRRQHE